MAQVSTTRALESGSRASAVVVTGMPDRRREDGLPQRTLMLAPRLEAALDVPVVSADLARYWAIFHGLGISPRRGTRSVLAMLS